MKISSQRGYLASLESVAMTDIVLNMFIFFFISFSLLYTFNPHRVRKLEIKLPHASSTSQLSDHQQIKITLTKEGSLFLNEQLVSMEELKTQIQTLNQQSSPSNVVLNADRLVSFKDIVKVIDILRASGITNLNIAAISDKT